MPKTSMKLQLYNTLTRKKEECKPINKKEVTMYTCGPTVYWFAHIGNFRAYIFADTLKRVLKFNGYKVKHIMNITDVGHLTNDSDNGDDKMETAAKKEKKTAQEIAQYYYDAFIEDFNKLDLEHPKKYTWATKYIQEQIDIVKTLEKKGYTYQIDDGVYFNTSKFPEYGKLSNKKAEKQEAGKRVKMGEKKHSTDFALWKFSNSKEKRQQEWDSPWGRGFPGWHIECSAMAMKELGKTIDIHTGGEDHVHIHHENEIAQSECATGKPFVNIWMHNAFINVANEKMSKSKGNIYTIEELAKKGIQPLSYKFYTYSAVYRKPLNVTIQALESAQENLKTLKRLIREINDDKKTNTAYLKKFQEAINDDLNMPQAIAVLWELVRDKDAKGKYQAIQEMDTVLGLELLQKESIPAEIDKLAKERQKAREHKDFKKSDELREKIREKGYAINDTSNGYTIEKA